MEKNREPNRFANLSQEELVGYTLVAYETERFASRKDENTSFK